MAPRATLTLALVFTVISLPQGGAMLMLDNCGGKANRDTFCSYTYYPDGPVRVTPRIGLVIALADEPTDDGFYNGQATTSGFWAGYGILYTPAFIDCEIVEGEPTCVSAFGFGTCEAQELCSFAVLIQETGAFSEHGSGVVANLSPKAPWIGCLFVGESPTYNMLSSFNADNSSGLECGVPPADLICVDGVCTPCREECGAPKPEQIPLAMRPRVSEWVTKCQALRPLVPSGSLPDCVPMISKGSGMLPAAYPPVQMDS
ncbi:MAG: hypothetical protein QOD77_1592 [Thermoplasmata archaeon]|nr:hypothetical protein [Thermoplasmata archaeon]